jgi:hypothetical protein
MSSKKKSKSPKLQIAETYVKVLNEYFALLGDSEIIKEMGYPLSILCVGVNAIHRVFEIVFIKTHSIEKTYYYSKKAYYYYLEYIEQIYRANLFQNLNHMDIVLFVYKKTVFEMYNGNDENSCTLSNIMTANNEVLIIDDNEAKDLFLKIYTMVGVIFYWDNTNITFIERCSILSKYIQRFIYKSHGNDSVMQYLKVIQERLNMNFVIYEELLQELLKKSDMIELRADGHKDNIIQKFYMKTDVCLEKWEAGNMKEFVKWIMV